MAARPPSSSRRRGTSRRFEEQDEGLPLWSARRVPGKTTLFRCIAKRSESGIPEMMLTTFREHLAAELQCCPEQPRRSFQSYAVTTAALTRTILEYLGIDDLTVPAMHGGTYRLKTVLDRIIHFRAMWPETVVFGDT